MFNLTRVEDSEPNMFRVETEDGYIVVAGSSQFVSKMIPALCESNEFEQILRENLGDMTKKDVAQEMRRAGFPEEIVVEFENNDFWPSLLEEK